MSMTADEQAALAGFTVAFFNSNKELKAIWTKARKEQWDGTRIVAAMRKTKWFKKHSEAQRKAQLLKTSDPAEYKRRLKETRAQVAAISKATGLGVQAGKGKTGNVLNKVAQLAFLHQWSPEQIKQQLARYGGVQALIRSPRFQTKGLMAEGERMARQLSRDYGIGMSTNTHAVLARDYALGTRSADSMRDFFMHKAMNKYSGVADEIRQGMTVRQIAEPYIDSMARLWEVNPQDISVGHRRILEALTSKDANGKSVAMNQGQFEDVLRKDTRWLSTHNARESIFGGAHRVLQDMGFVF